LEGYDEKTGAALEVIAAKMAFDLEMADERFNNGPSFQFFTWRPPLSRASVLSDKPGAGVYSHAHVTLVDQDALRLNPG
jgi:hypothetical protein